MKGSDIEPGRVYRLANQSHPLGLVLPGAGNGYNGYWSMIAYREARPGGLNEDQRTGIYPVAGLDAEMALYDSPSGPGAPHKQPKGPVDSAYLGLMSVPSRDIIELA